MTKHKASIIYLTQPGRLSYLRHGLELLHINFLNRFPYPVRIFQEGDIDDEQVKDIEDKFPLVNFVTVNLSPPTTLNIGDKETWEYYPRFSVGYHNMCRFFSYGFLDYTQDLDFVMRLDDDSEILSEISTDLFDDMYKNNFAYAYRCEMPEFLCCRGIDDFYKGLCQKLSLPSKRWENKVYYSNFSMFDLRAWRSELAQHFIKAIDESCNIYHKRWGDHTVQTMISRIVFPDQIKHFKYFKYAHHNIWEIGASSKNVA